MARLTAFTLILIPFLLLSCKDLFQYSPNEVRLEEEQRDLNAKNIRKILSTPLKDTFRFAVFGDSQRFYEEMDDLVTAVNKRKDLSFVVLNGDITDFGLNREYRWIQERLARFNVPYLAVIGNHDMLANGRLVYQKMFGPENFSFTSGQSKFIFLNSNSRETGFDGSIPDLGWLKKELADSTGIQHSFVFCHVAPYHADFDPGLELPYSKLLSGTPSIEMSIHGHEHGFNIYAPYNDGVPYLVTGSINRRSFCIITVTKEGHAWERVFY